jgi:hypothetical protein
MDKIQYSIKKSKWELSAALGLASEKIPLLGKRKRLNIE